MKERITLDIAGSTLNLITDQDREYVNRLGELLSDRVKAITMGGAGGRTEALMLICMELLDERVRDTARLRESERLIARLKKQLACAEAERSEEGEETTEEALEENESAEDENE